MLQSKPTLPYSYGATSVTLNNKALLPSIEKISAEELQQRVEVLRARMCQANMDAVMLVAGNNMRYFTGLAWGMTERLVGCLVTQEDIIYLCPKFEESALAAAVRWQNDYAFWHEHQDPSQLVWELMGRRNLNSLAVDPDCPLWLFERLHGTAGDGELRSAVKLLGGMRACKSANELALISKAMQITLKVQQLTFGHIRPGMRSSEVIKYIDNAHRQLGADNGSYFCAVQFAEGTSHPHGVPGDPVLQDNSLVLIDTGCQIDGYHSDITRSFAIGNVSQKIKDTWEVEKAAQQAAFDAAKCGVPCENVDLAARQIIVQHGLGPDYDLPGLPHRTGHGIGLEIHEAPYLVKGDKTPLAEGMCFSNEPMIVFPNEFGVRLEDHFYMTPEGAVWFTQPQVSIDRPFG